MEGSVTVIKSSALEANLASYHFDVAMDPRYAPIQSALSRYYGIMEGVGTFLKELSHPLKNWQFIVRECRGYSLNYFHLLKAHEQGPAAAALFIEIFIDVLGAPADAETRSDAVDNLLLFIQKIIKESGDRLIDFLPVVQSACDAIHGFNDTDFFLFVKSYYQINRLAALHLKALAERGLLEDLGPESPPAAADDDPQGAASKVGASLDALWRLTARYYRAHFQYWLSQPGPLIWFEKEIGETTETARYRPLFDTISHDHARRRRDELAAIAGPDARGEGGGRRGPAEISERINALLALPGYSHFVEEYREMPRRLWGAGEKIGKGNHWKVLFLFHIMNVMGLSVIHEDALRDINRTLSWLITHEKHMNLEKLIRKTFSLLSGRMAEFPSTALNCVLNMGKGVYQTDDSELINFFIDEVIDLGFQAPRVGGVGNDWQIQVNPAHILNIRTWLRLIETKPRWSTRLLSALIIHLTLCGVFVRDTDLFPRDITSMLNSPVEPVYSLVKQLARLFPVYFNDIGAEGELRDISTQIDEISHRKDTLIHFLRKQIHVESSNRIVGFMGGVLRLWAGADKAEVAPYLPPSIYEEVDPEGPFMKGVRTVVSGLAAEGVAIPEDLAGLSQERLAELLERIGRREPSVTADDIERVRLAAILYRILHQKYDPSLFRSESLLEAYLSKLQCEAFPRIEKLKRAVSDRDLKSRIFGMLDYLEELKKLVVSPQTFEAREDIYKKRHFTVDIPSMYGSYREAKFDALGLTFRVEAYLNVLFEQLIDNIDLSLVTKATFYQIYDKLILFDKALRVDGMNSVEFQSRLDLLAHSLDAEGFTFTQYLDIFKGFAQSVKNIIADYFNNIHEENLDRVLAALPLDQVQPRYLPRGLAEFPEENRENLRHSITEVFFREKISACLGLQQLDRFLSRILNTLFHQSYKLPSDRLRVLLNYDPYRAMMSILEPKSNAAGIIYLGNKGFNLVKLRNFGLPVPPGFIITTEVFRCWTIVDAYGPAQENFREQVAGHISSLEKISRRRFGDPEDPLILSVRSGSSISQPGMMDTFLDVGMNEAIAEGLAERSGNQWFAWDCYRRFLQCWGMGHGMKRDEFDSVIKTFKDLWNIPYKKGFPGAMMRSVALAYKDLIEKQGVEIAEDPFDQLMVAIKMVFQSWDTPKAQAYRRIMGISDDWGTAVTVQAMVFGNRSLESGTGVFFTHNPRWPGDDSIRLWGDFTTGNQGEDVVSGLVNTMPISISQQNIEMRDTDTTLETHYPEIYRTLKGWAEDLIYKKRWSPQEMEFTFESARAEDLYLLQTRDMAIRERKRVMPARPVHMPEERRLGHGIGVSGGLMSGRIVFTLEDIDQWRKTEPKTPLILLRSDTVPDDIRELNAADGILTARGGLTSHAAVVAHRLEKTCVVGCGGFVCKESDKVGIFDHITLKAGDFITIDGQEGAVYEGRIETESPPAAAANL